MEEESVLRKYLREEAQKNRDSIIESSGQWTLGQLRDSLIKAPPTFLLYFSDGRGVGYFDRWRGIYSEIAICPIEPSQTHTVQTQMELAIQSIGRTFTGYKGGDYTMTRETPVWVSPHGQADSYMVVGFEVLEDCVIIQIKEREPYDYE